MKLDRSTILILLGIVIAIFIFNIFTREGFYDNVLVSGTGLSVGPINGMPPAMPPTMPPASAMPPTMPPAMPSATQLATSIDLPAATKTVQPIATVAAPLTQVGSLGIQPIATQQVTDMAGNQAVSSIQKGVVSTDSMPAAVAPTSGSFMGPTMGVSSGSSSMDSCGSDTCGSDTCGSDTCNSGSNDGNPSILGRLFNF